MSEEPKNTALEKARDLIKAEIANRQSQWKDLDEKCKMLSAEMRGLNTALHKLGSL